MKPHGAHHNRRCATLLVLGCLLALAATLPASGTTSSADKQLKKVNHDESQLRASVKHESTKSSSSAAATANQKDQAATNNAEAVAAAAAAAVQPSAEKKQSAADAAEAAASADSEEYVQIKPEEITVNEHGKEIDSSGSSTGAQLDNAQQQQAEHKSIDDELSAHLAQETISQMESSYSAYASMPAAPSAGHQRQAAPRSAPAYGSYTNKHQPPPAPPAMPAYHRAPRAPHHGPPRMPPSYITLKGKLTGINSLISQYPHPAPGYPHMGPRHLPRGAAAGYAAFRDFVRAHASKYKQAVPSMIGPQYGAPPPPPYSGPVAAAPPAQYGGAAPAAPQYGGAAPAAPQYGGEAPPPAKSSYKEPAPAAMSAYNVAPAAPKPAYGGAPSKGAGYSKPSKTKVTVAQAYIPHPPSAPEAGSYGQQPQASGYGGAANQAPSSGPYTSNPMLAKLYGNHAPQGAGKTEYNKDYGMVIHYPQATVYTEPMSVEKLHKLTGAGISQVLEQLQYNLANGHRDETNTIRANNKHHIGNGVHIHAKEYYAPGKGGQYVPTTAAVISTSGDKGSYEQAAEQPMGAYGPPAKMPELGSGYERVKQAVAASQNKYNQKYNGGAGHGSASGDYHQPQQQYGGEQQGAGKYGNGNGEPLSAITSFIGSELDALYKANAALTKQLEPEIHAAIQAHGKSSYGKGPLKYSELNSQRSPFSAHGYPFMEAGPHHMSMAHPPKHYRQPMRGGHHYGGPHQGGNKYGGGPRGGRGPRKGGPYGGSNNRHPRPSGYQQQQQQQQQSGYRQQQQHQASASYQQQQQAYQAAEQALNQQMMQLLHDFHAGDEQYNGKGQAYQTVNQGYPHKIMQKYQQQQQQQQQNYQQQQQQQQAYGQQSAYGLHDGLEIPQGPNDQIGEIADLIEALKGSLDMSKPETQGEADSYAPAKQAGKQEDVRYLASALGQAPSYAMQVPVSGDNSDSYEKDAHQQAQPQQPQAYEQPQQQQQQSNGYQQQQPTGGYQQQQAAPSAGYAQPAAPASYAQQAAPAGYAQQAAPASYAQQAAPAGYAQQAAPSGYEQQQPMTAGYGSQHQPQQQQQAPPASYGQPQEPAGYAPQAPAASGYAAPPQQQAEYQQQQQQQQPQLVESYQQAAQAAGDYSGAQPQQHQQMSQAYGGAPTAAGGSYGGAPVAAAAPAVVEQPQAASGYSSSEHTQVINHLVPAVSQASGYESTASQGSSSSHHQPANQIAVAAPTESQYQQAQSLSSFVDSLPTDYQELLRQPALIDGNSGHGHLAALGQEAPSSSSSSSSSGYGANNAAPSQANSAPAASQQQAYEAAPQSLAQPAGHHMQQQQQQSAGSHEQLSYQSQAKGHQAESHNGGSGSQAGQQEYRTVKK